MYEILSETDKHTKLIELLSGFLGDYRKHYSRKCQISFDCPQCGQDKGVSYDKKGNLEINYRKGKYNCWACGEETGMFGNLKSLFDKWADVEYITAFKGLKLHFTYENIYGESVEYVPKDILRLPSEFSPLAGVPEIGLNVKFFNYLRERRITDDIISKYNIGCAFSGKYENRIILPSYDEDGELNFFVTRTINKKEKKFKYLNCEIEKKTIIFNEHLIDWEKTIFIVEGPFDHIVLPNSIPLLGKQMSDLLFKNLYYNTEAKIVLVLDPDAWSKAVNIYNKLDAGRLRGKILTVKMPEDKDVSKFNQDHGQEALFKYIRENTRKLID